jgi:antitoxin HicB
MMIPDVPYRFTIRPLPADEGGGYLIEFPDLPGCMSDGATIEQAITNGVDAMRGWVEAMRAEGHPIPRRPRGPLADPLAVLQPTLYS